jgi:hypothetical protein
MNLDGNLTELVAVCTSVVTAEEKIAAAGKNNAYIRLGAAAVTTVGRIENWNWNGCGNGTCHSYLQQLGACNASWPSLLMLCPHYACLNLVHASFGARERSQTCNVFVGNAVVTIDEHQTRCHPTPERRCGDVRTWADAPPAHRRFQRRFPTLRRRKLRAQSSP